MTFADFVGQVPTKRRQPLPNGFGSLRTVARYRRQYFVKRGEGGRQSFAVFFFAPEPVARQYRHPLHIALDRIGVSFGGVDPRRVGEERGKKAHLVRRRLPQLDLVPVGHRPTGERRAHVACRQDVQRQRIMRRKYFAHVEDGRIAHRHDGRGALFGDVGE